MLNVSEELVMIPAQDMHHGRATPVHICQQRPVKICSACVCLLAADFQPGGGPPVGPSATRVSDAFEVGGNIIQYIL